MRGCYPTKLHDAMTRFLERIHIYSTDIPDQMMAPSRNGRPLFKLRHGPLDINSPDELRGVYRSSPSMIRRGIVPPDVDLL